MLCKTCCANNLGAFLIDFFFFSFFLLFILLFICFVHSQSSLDTYAQYYVCFVDFKKAFDTVDRNTLIQKLIRLGLHGEIIHALGEICSKNFQQVADGCNLSNKIPQLIGVTQGDKLSPLLFSLFIADLPVFIDSNQCLIILYADDLIIASPFLLDVKRSLNDLHEYCRINKLTVNVQKTNMMKYRKGGPLKKSDKVFYGYEEIGFTNSFCYLGYNLSPSLTITTHLKHLVRSAIRSTFALQQKLPFSKITRLLFLLHICPFIGCLIYSFFLSIF